MAWSDAAREAAAEARRMKSKDNTPGSASQHQNKAPLDRVAYAKETQRIRGQNRAAAESASHVASQDSARAYRTGLREHHSDAAASHDRAAAAHALAGNGSGAHFHQAEAAAHRGVVARMGTRRGSDFS